MSELTSIFISVKTSEKDNSQTDDNIYLGVEGTGGGREFLLDVSNYDDFQKGVHENYNLGGVTSTQIQTLLNQSEIPFIGYRVPYDASQGGINDPASYPIDFQQIDRVYLRKMGDRVKRGDNALIIDEIAVWLYSDEGERRKFFCGRQFRLGSEYGLQVWLFPVRLISLIEERPEEYSTER
ncbi:MAG: hypothetical protein KC441_16230 [Anaerolineales bacterium]|nr:hypothetical protein [Anaerolineales bacterium]